MPLRTSVSVLLLCYCLGFGPTTASAAEPLTLGIFPYLNASELLCVHRTLVEFLMQALHQPLNIVSAPDFDEFRQRTAQREYDILITASGGVGGTRDRLSACIDDPESFFRRVRG